MKLSAIFLTVFCACFQASNEEELFLRFKGYTSLPVEDIWSNVTSLFLDYNQITAVDEFPFHNVHILWLNNNRLTEFPEVGNSSSTVFHFNLAYNQIAYIARDRLSKLTYLGSLVLNNNNLTASTVPDAAPPSPYFNILELGYNRFDVAPVWQTFTIIRILSLRNNLINFVPDAAFDDMKHLTSLDLADNLLSHVPNLGHLPKLNVLTLDHNDIGEISTETLYNLTTHTSVSVLHLAYNPLTDGSIQDLDSPHSNVTEIHLSHNQFKVFPVWPNLGISLEILDLAYNDISNLSDSDLDVYPKLQSLILTGNKIVQFPHLMQNGPRLHSIYLDSNRLNSCDIATLEPLKNCTTIDISNNTLQNLPSFCSADFDMTFTLHLDDSHLVCDHNLFWILAAASASAFHISFANTYCVSPGHLEDQAVDVLMTDTLHNETLGHEVISCSRYQNLPFGFKCNLPIGYVFESKSRLQCSMLCSQTTACIMFGFHAQDQYKSSKSRGVCAITIVGGVHITTGVHFDWYVATHHKLNGV